MTMLRRAPLVLAPAAVAAGPLLGQAPATEARPEPTAAPAPTAELPEIPEPREALFWADWSGDGLADAWAVQPDGSGLLLENLGDGTFTNRTAAAGLDQVTGSHHAAWGDVDGDGSLDLYLASFTGPSRLFLQAAPGDFIDVTPTSGLPTKAQVLDASWIDFDADGVLDLRLVTGAEESVHRGLGRARFERVRLGLALRTGAATRPAAVTPPPSSARAANPNATPAPPAGSLTTNSGICAGTLIDQATGQCLDASSTPMLGSLYPLSSDLFVSPAGQVGIGTTSPSARLAVSGTVRASGQIWSDELNAPPLVVRSSQRVQNLNADLLDGLSSAQFYRTGVAIPGTALAPGSIGSVQVQDLSLVDLDISTTAAIRGTKIFPDFGSQLIQGVDGARIDRPFVVGDSAVRGGITGLEATGYLGVAGGTDHDGTGSLEIDGLDIGVLGVSTGGSLDDNYGMLGHATYAGVRGEHSVSPGENYGELGLDGVGVFGKGTDAAGRFEGTVEIESTGTALTAIGGATGAPAFNIANPDGGTVLRAVSEIVGGNGTGSAMEVVAQNRGSAALLSQTSLDAARPALQVDAVGTSAGHATAAFRKAGIGAAGPCTTVEVTSTLATGTGLTVDNNGSGVGASIESGTGVTMALNKTGNSGSILTASNGADIEFRVDSSGDVFCDGAFNGGGADYAEWLPQRDPAEHFAKGDVVGVHAGRISRDLRGAEALLVISTDPCLVGNVPGAEGDARENHQIVAFMGQVPVRVLGPVERGDLLVPSGRGDGVALAVAPEDLDPRRIDRVIGRAWESATGPGEHRVNASIGLGHAQVTRIAFQAVHAELAAMRNELEGLTETVGSFAGRLEALEASR